MRLGLVSGVGMSVFEGGLVYIYHFIYSLKGFYKCPLFYFLMLFCLHLLLYLFASAQESKSCWWIFALSWCILADPTAE